jgi:hemerythrin
MSFVSWSSEFSVGIAEFDNEHRRLLELINDLYDAVQAGSGREALGAVLDGLIDYVGYHFAHEEEAFQATNYPGYERHRLQHRALTTTVGEIYEDFKLGDSTTMPQQVLEFLKNWLYDHILGSDRAFGVYYASRMKDVKPEMRQASGF